MSIEYKLIIVALLAILGIVVVRRAFRSSVKTNDAATVNSAVINHYSGWDRNESDGN